MEDIGIKVEKKMMDEKIKEALDKLNKEPLITSKGLEPFLTKSEIEKILENELLKCDIQKLRINYNVILNVKRVLNGYMEIKEMK